MASKLLTVVLLAVAAVVHGLPSRAPASHVVHEKRHALNLRWIKHERVRPSAVFPVRIGLAQSNMEQAHELLMDV